MQVRKVCEASGKGLHRKQFEMMVYVREQFWNIKEGSRKTLKIMVIKLELALSNISKVDNQKRARLIMKNVCCELLFYKPKPNGGAEWMLLYTTLP